MTNKVPEILQNHLQLCQWQDELEFLCFILYNIISPPDNQNTPADQTPDLLKFIERINKASQTSGGRMGELLRRNEISNLKHCLQKTKRVRNLVAHHVPISNHILEKERAVVQSAIETLEAVIQKGAKKYHINQINWYPIAHTATTIPNANDFFRVGIIISDSSVLSCRQRYLQRGAFCQEYLSKEQERWLQKERQSLLKSHNDREKHSSRKPPTAGSDGSCRTRKTTKHRKCRNRSHKSSRRRCQKNIHSNVDRSLSSNSGILMLGLLALVNLLVALYLGG